MISVSEVDDKAREFNIAAINVEKDYVHGRVLQSLYSSSPLGKELVLKGGNCLRKAYFPETRFSKDLDFSLAESIDESFLKEELNRICKRIQSDTGIDFDTDRTIVRNKDLPIPGVDVLEARLYFKGFYKEEKIDLKTQLDITQFDRIYLPVQTRSLIHPYSDSNECAVMLRCQKVEEVLASKLTTLLHRRKAIDLFDLLYSILIAKDFTVNRLEVISTFLRKSVFEGQPVAARDELLAVPLEEFRTIWTDIIGPVSSLLSFDYVIANFSALIEGLFALIVGSPAASAGAGGGMMTPWPTLRNIPARELSYSRPYFPSTIRNAILNGGRTSTMVRLLYYDGLTRLVEPYKLEFRVRKSDGRGLEYFWAWDPFASGKSNKPGIRQYICDRIRSVETTNTAFTPRFEIEL